MADKNPNKIIDSLVKYEVYNKVGDKDPSYVTESEKDAHEYIRKGPGAAEIRVNKGDK